MDKYSVIVLFLFFVLFFLNSIHFDRLICFYVLYSFSHPATFINKLELSSEDTISQAALARNTTVPYLYRVSLLFGTTVPYSQALR